MGQDRRRDLQLAESARRRRRPWRADPRSPRGRTARNPHPRLAAAEGVPPHVEGRARRGRVQGRNDQHPVDARGRGRDLRARMGEVLGWSRRTESAQRRQRRRARQDRRGTRVAEPPRRRSRQPVEDLGLPVGHRCRCGFHQEIRWPARKGRRGL